MTTTDRLILASGSPRRRELLEAAGYVFDVIEPDESAECGVCSGTGPAALVAELAFRKAADVARRIDCGLVIAGDTVAESRGQILGKPTDRDHAERMLRELGGRQHRVLTGICVWRVPNSKPDVQVATTSLVMEALTDDQLAEYLDTDAWQGKAGAFGYQDSLGWVKVLEGSESNVVGLPMQLLEQMLAANRYHR